MTVPQRYHHGSRRASGVLDTLDHRGTGFVHSRYTISMTALRCSQIASGAIQDTVAGFDESAMVAAIEGCNAVILVRPFMCFLWVAGGYPCSPRRGEGVARSADECSICGE